MTVFLSSSFCHSQWATAGAWALCSAALLSVIQFLCCGLISISQMWRKVAFSCCFLALFSLLTSASAVFEILNLLFCEAAISYSLPLGYCACKNPVLAKPAERPSVLRPLCLHASCLWSQHSCSAVFLSSHGRKGVQNTPAEAVELPSFLTCTLTVPPRCKLLLFQLGATCANLISMCNMLRQHVPAIRPTSASSMPPLPRH